MGILRNGQMFQSSKPINIQGEYYTVLNTCAFDSLAQIFASAIVDSNMYNDICSFRNENYFFKVIQNIAESQIPQKNYKNRIWILRDILAVQNFQMT